jgi:Putative peptidoglycan binding domain
MALKPFRAFLVISSILFFGISFHAHAASRFWVGGTGSWDATAGTKWATSTGGVGGSAVPTAIDNVFFDANSTGTVSVTAAATAVNVDFTGFTQTFSGTSTLAVTGSLTLASGMTNSYAGAITFNATSGTQTITSNNIPLLSSVTFNGVGGTWQLGDDFNTTSSATVTLTNGTLNANNKNVTMGLWSSTNSNTRVILMGSGTWTLTGVGTVWSMATVGGATLTAGSSTVKLNNASATAKTFAGGGLTYNNLWFTGLGTGSLTLSGSNTFADFKVDTPPHIVRMTANSTTTVSTFTASGTAGNYINFQSVTGGTSYAFIKSGGGTITSDYLILSDFHATPTSAWDPGAHSLNVIGNTGWIFPSIPTGGTNGNTNALWVAAARADGTTPTLAYSYDGTTWNSLGKTIFSTNARGLAWDGRRWVVAGQGTNSLAYSDDGINYTGLGTSIFSTRAFMVASNGSRWVAVGQGTNTLAYSDDGINWVGLGTSIFGTRAFGIAWNGSMWLAGGETGNTLAYSRDGINWVGEGTSVFSTFGLGFAWDGTKWVALGGGTNSIAYSTDGINWTGEGTSIFSSQANAIAWNGTRFAAAGTGTNTIAYSSDGITWTGIGTSLLSSFGLGMAWDGTRFIAAGEGTNSLVFSLDGINWIGLGNGVFSVQATAVASAPAPKLYPSLDFARVNVSVSGSGSGTVTSSGGISVTYPGASTGSTSTISSFSTVITAQAASGQLSIMDDTCHAYGGTLTKVGTETSVCVIASVGTSTVIAVVFAPQSTVGTGGGSGGSNGGGSSAPVTPPTPIVPSTPTNPTTPSTPIFSGSLPALNVPVSLYKFTRNLKLLMTGNDVKELQKYLNKNGFPVAFTGAGSVGNETTKFGALTKAALIKFQEYYNNQVLVPAGVMDGRGTGYLGPFTRKIINAQ